MITCYFRGGAHLNQTCPICGATPNATCVVSEGWRVHLPELSELLPDQQAVDEFLSVVRHLTPAQLDALRNGDRETFMRLTEEGHGEV